MNGNVSAEGARLDLDWMQRIGIGGVHAFSGGGLPAPQVINPPVPFMSHRWKETFRNSLDHAQSAGMEFGIAGSPGWHVTGGPWVAPGDGMKKYVWSEQAVTGGRPFRDKLPDPPRTTGPFQDHPGGKSKATAYGEAAVIAFPTPRGERALPEPLWTSAGAAIELGQVSAKLPWSETPLTVSLEARFDRPVQVSAIALTVDEGANLRLLAELDGELRALNHVDVRPAREGDERPAHQQTVSFAPVTAVRFVLVFTPLKPEPATALTAITPRVPQKSLTVRHARWIGGARIASFEAKAGFTPSLGPDAPETPPAPRDAIVRSDAVIDLTRRMSPDGTLEWTPPPGEWTVLRFGWSLTGTVNGPAEPAALGLEVDKFDPAAVRRYLHHYLDLYREATGREMGPQGVQSLITDSWESKVQNWTPAMLAEFRVRRGYDAVRFLPTLVGRVVDSSEASERFLFDFRRTLKELLADNHYGVLATELKARGVQYYSEALGDNARAIGDGLAIKARADIPTAEYWYRAFATVEGQPPLKADIEEAASAAHLYGKPLVAAEALTVAALTDAWSFSPAMLKPVADEIFARGVNRFLIHESHHQPVPQGKPGMQLFLWGQYFNRNETWAEHAAPWVTYLARTSHLLQQGTFVADVAYFYGEEQNLTELFLHRFNTDVPPGYKYDYVNAEALLTLLSVRDGRIVTPSGMSYAVLYLPDHVRRLSLPVLQKLRELVSAGAVLVGKRPLGGLGLASGDREVLRLARDLWGAGATPAERRFGSGRIYTDLPEALRGEGVAADLAFEGTTGDGILFLHRRTADEDIYFVSNQTDRQRELSARFRVGGRAPQIWRADSGTMRPASYQVSGSTTRVPLSMEAHEALFVVFRDRALATAWTAPVIRRSRLIEVEGLWTVSFASGLGAPAQAAFEKLLSWPDSPIAGIRYFSGAATYRREVTIAAEHLQGGHRIELDLGQVRELAAVSVNGVRIGTAWKPPYRLDITAAVKPGSNRLEIEVVNLWPNRLIGDRQPGAERIAFAPDSRYGPSSPLLPSGLLGPVHVNSLAAS